jgi:hypothetical protein
MAKEVLADLLRKRSTAASTSVSSSKLLPHELTAQSTIMTCDLFRLLICRRIRNAMRIVNAL